MTTTYTTGTFSLASDKQLDFIRALLIDTGRTVKPDFPWSKLSKTQASAMIDMLISEKKTKNVTKMAQLTEGMYLVDGVVYKVQISKSSGKPYAKRLVKLHTPKVLKTKTITHTFEYAAGAVYKIKPENKMTLEQAAAFGVNTGTCCVCGALLTNDKSVKAGIGPVCAKKF